MALHGDLIYQSVCIQP